jgi:hypothetical protein
VKSGRRLLSLRRDILSSSSGKEYELGLLHHEDGGCIFFEMLVIPYQIYMCRNSEVTSRNLLGETEEEQEIISH